MANENLLVPIVGAAGTLADYVTTQVGLRTPGVIELNPLVHPLLEGAFAVGGPLIVSFVGKKLGVPRPARVVLMLIPAAIPLVVAIRNLFIIAAARQQQYSFNEFPLLYG